MDVNNLKPNDTRYPPSDHISSAKYMLFGSRVPTFACTFFLPMSPVEEDVHAASDEEDSRFYMDYEDEQQEQLEQSSSSSGSDNEDEDDVVPDIQWPQSYRKSMDLYSHMASPVSYGSLLSTSSSRQLLPTSERDAIVQPLLPPKLQQRAPSIVPEARVSIAADLHHKIDSQSCSFLQTTMNGINVLAGVGVLTTPFALKEAGWIGVPVLMVFALLCCYTGVLLRRCLDSGPGLVTYPDIGQAAFGRAGRLLTSILLYTELFACCVEFMILEGDNLSSLFPGGCINIAGLPVERHKVFSTIAALFILPTVWLRDLSLLSYISAGGVLSSVIVALSVLWVGTVDKVGFSHTGPLANLGRLPVAMGLFGFCFSGHAIFPNIYSSMKKGARFNQVLQVCFGFCILLYGGVAVMGYKMFGAATLSQVTLNLPKEFVATKLALWTTVITPLTKYALSITPVALSLEELLPNSTNRHWASVGIRTSLVISTLLVALLIPFFAFVMALIGSFLSVTGSLILPCACYLSIQRGKLSTVQRAVAIFTILLGVVAAITGTYSSVSSIVNQL